MDTHVQAMRNIKHVMDNGIGAPPGGMVTAETNVWVRDIHTYTHTHIT